MRFGIFIFVSALLAYISRKSFLYPRSHGIARFFAWEAILALLMLNASPWIEEQFTPLSLLSAIFLAISIYLVAHGIFLLKTRGKQDSQKRPDPALLGFEKTSNLVTVGVYKYIRHPMCSSLLFLTWGVFLKNPTWMGFLLALLASGFLILTAKIDESECISYFGREYRAYMKNTSGFIPFIF